MKAQLISLLTLVIGQLFNSGTSFGSGGGGGGTETPSSVFRRIALASDNAVRIKAGAGTVTGWAIGNTAQYKILVQLYDLGVTPDPTMDTPKLTISVEASLRSDEARDLDFTSGIGMAITKADGSAVLAGDAAVNIFYL